MQEGIVLPQSLPVWKKVMYAVFFAAKILAIQVLIPKGKSMNVRFYKKKNLRRHVKFYQKRQSKTGISGNYLSHDKA